MTRATMLSEYLAMVRRRRFRVGSHDCAMFVAGWVKTVTGVDHARGWRGSYRSLKRGQEAVRAAGFEDHVALVASLLPEVPPAMAQTGDLAVIEGAALGIVGSDRVFVLRSDGVGHVSRLLAKRAFRV